MTFETHLDDKVVIVGLGSIGQRHLKNLAELGFTKIIAVTSKTKSAFRHLPLDIMFVKNIDEALELRPFAAIVSSPTALHTRYALSLLRSGVHTLVEKPLAASLDQFQELKSVARSNGITCATVYQMRQHPSVHKLRDMLRQKILIDPYYIRIEVGQYLPQWHQDEDYRFGGSAKRRLGGGVILDLIHEIDLARHLFGPFDKISSLYGNLSELEIETEDYSDIFFSSRKHFVNVHLDYFQHSPSRSIRVNARNGTVFFDLWRSTAWFSDTAGNTTRIDLPVVQRDDLFKAELREFFGKLNNPKYREQNLADSISSLKLALSVKAARSEWKDLK